MAYPPIPDGGEEPFKVVGRRRFSSYSTTQPAEEKYALPTDPLLDECDEAFRTACLGGLDEPPSEAKEPLYVVKDRRHRAQPEEETHPTYQSPRNLPSSTGSGSSKGLLATIGIGIVGLGALYFASQYNAPQRNHESPSSSVTQTQSQPIYKASRPEVDLTSFREYRKTREAEYAELSNGEQIQLNEISIPPEIQAIVNDPAYTQHAFAIDLNEDGIDEVIIQEGCGSGGCWGKVFQKTDSGYAVIISDYVDLLSKERTNGYRNVYSGNKTYLPAGGFTNPFRKYVWDGQAYVKSGVVLDPANIPDVSNNLRMFLRTGNASDAQKSLRELEERLGTDNILSAMLLSQLAPDIPLPEGDELDRFLIQLSEDQGINYRDYVSNPEGLRRVLFGSMTNNIMMSPKTPGQLVFAGGVSIAGSITKALGLDARSQYIQTLRRVSSRLDDYINRTGNIPNDQRLADLLYQGAAFAIREDELRTYQGSSEVIGSTRTNPDGTSQYRGDIYPGATPEQIRSIQAQQQHDAIQRQGQQNINQFRQDVGRGVQGAQRGLQQGTERARQMGNQILKVLPKPPEKKPPGK